MMRLLSKLARDRRGVAAVELAFIAPVVAGLVTLSFEAWRQATRAQEIDTALTAGVEYYMAGGKDDTAGQSVALAAWSHAPSGASVSISRGCICGSTTHSCTTLCSNLTVPEIRVTLTANATYPTGMFAKTLTDSQVVRVR